MKAFTTVYTCQRTDSRETSSVAELMVTFCYLQIVVFSCSNLSISGTVCKLCDRRI